MHASNLTPCLTLCLILMLATLQAFSGEAAGRTYVVNQNHPQASDKNEGTADLPFKSITPAAERAMPGDTVLVHAGTYRERVTPARSGNENAPITYMAAHGEKVYIKGSDVFAGAWAKVEGNVYEGKLGMGIFKGENPFHRTISIAGGDKSKEARPVADGELPETLGQVFVNGRPYYQVMDRKILNETEGSWMVNRAGDAIVVNFKSNEADASEQLVEISARNRIFSPYRRGLRYIHVRGFIMEQCANQGPFPQGGAFSIRSGSHWLIEDNTIRYSKTIGLDIGSEYWDGKAIAQATPTAKADQKLIIAKHNIIRNNIVSDNGLCGIAGWNNRATIITGNTVERNNHLGYPHGGGWEEWAGIKLHCSDALIAGNLVRDNEAHGIWIDNDYGMAQISRNTILNNLQSGIFLELGGAGKGCLIDNNVIGYTRSQGGFYNGNGIYTHDASDITAAHNLFIANAGFGVCMRVVSNRKFGGKLTETSNEKIYNNIFVGNNLGGISLPADSSRSGNNKSDYNYYAAVWGGEGKPQFYTNKFLTDFNWDTVTNELMEKLKAKGVEDKYWPNPASWRIFPALHLNAWRAFSGQDEHSRSSSDAEGKIGFRLRARQPELGFTITPDLLEMKCPHVEDADVDYYGNPIPQEGAKPGPFQNIGEGKINLPLVNAIKDPQLRLTPAQKERKRQEDFIGKATGAITKSGNDEKYVFPEGDVWFRSNQPDDNPSMNGPYPDPIKADAGELMARSSRGVCSSPAACVLFDAPAEGIYKYELTGGLTKRTANTAGYTQVQLIIADVDFKNVKVIGSEICNTPGGYLSEKNDQNFNLEGEVALPKGWHLIMRFQVVSPGPAPAGYGNAKISSFIMTRLSQQ
ncbi:MAG: right-handed parallel beta-helix repeat-containing protein [Planctomycetes bacterium]|nr:right-handed parallel beta-helix repeat-containing protein [Planctomycetota bacterium]